MFIESELKKSLLKKDISLRFDDNTDIIKLFSKNNVYITRYGKREKFLQSNSQQYRLRDGVNDVIFKIEFYPYLHIAAKTFSYKNGKYEESFIYNTDLKLKRYFKTMKPKYFGLDIHRLKPVLIDFENDITYVYFRKNSSIKDERIITTYDRLKDLGIALDDITNIKLSSEEMEILKMITI